MDNFLITDVVNIYEFARTGATEGYGANPTYPNVNVCISPASTDIQIAYGDIASYQLFNIIIYDTTVIMKNADKIITQDGAEYEVKGRPLVMNTPFLSFIKILAQQVV
jgi:hypothetical protein